MLGDDHLQLAFSCCEEPCFDNLLYIHDYGIFSQFTRQTEFQAPETRLERFFFILARLRRQNVSQRKIFLCMRSRESCFNMDGIREVQVSSDKSIKRTISTKSSVNEARGATGTYNIQFAPSYVRKMNSVAAVWSYFLALRVTSSSRLQDLCCFMSLSISAPRVCRFSFSVMFFSSVSSNTACSFLLISSDRSRVSPLSAGCEV